MFQRAKKLLLSVRQDLYDASANGDVAQVMALVGNNAVINQRRSDGVTPLVLAANGGHLDVVHILLEKGADPNLTTSEGWHAYTFAKNQNHSAVAARLLVAHGGIEPQHDYSSAWLQKVEPAKLAVYGAIYSPEALRSKRFYNIGSGQWRHPHWTNVDYASDYYNYDKSLIDLPWDISLLAPIEAGDAIAEAAFCSHTCEHLTDEQNRHMFREMRRILKPGAVFRVTCPNVQLYWEAYQRRDVYIRQQYGYDEPFGSDTGYSAETMGRWLINEVATQLIQKLGPEHEPRLGRADVAEIDRQFAGKSLEQALEALCSSIDYDIQRKYPGNHINWWTPEKMVRELRAAGFASAIVSVPGGSVCPIMRDRVFFDTVSPTFSLFVEAWH